MGQEGAHLTPKQSHHVHQLLGSLVTSRAEEGKESVTFSLFVLKISRIKSLGSHLPLSFPIILASFLSFLCFPVRRPPALQAVLCYVLICMRMHLATFYVCWVVQKNTVTHVHVLSLTHTRFNNMDTLLHFFNFGFLIHQMGMIFQRKLS